MITKWKLFNFKSIRNETELDFAPLTVFAGSNSSGKSTVLQSMLLIAQTLSNKVGSKSVVLNGDLVRLGQFDDLKSHGSDVDQVLIGWAWKPEEDGSVRSRNEQSGVGETRFYGMAPRAGDVFECRITFDADPSDPARDLLQLRPKLFGSEMIVSSADRGGNAISIVRSGNWQLKLSGTSIMPDSLDAPFSSLDYSVQLDNDLTEALRDEFPSHEIIGCDMHHFAPKNLLLKVDTRVEDVLLISRIITEGFYRGAYQQRLRNRTIPTEVWQFLEDKFSKKDVEEIFALLPGERPSDRLRSSIEDRRITVRDWIELAYRRSTGRPSRILGQLRGNLDIQRELFDYLKKLIPEADETTESAFEIVPAPLPSPIAMGFRYFEDRFTDSLKYLGPLRDEPKPLYPYSVSSAPTHVGLRGELTAAVLELNREQKVQFLPPQALADMGKQSRQVTRSLQSAVTDWLRYLGVAEEVVTLDRGKLGHEMRVAVDGDSRATDLTHVGVGVSQVLPIVVMCLISGPDTTLIFEQPELHLHPKVQTLLGDFFLAMALSGRQCIIETHSEYLINRLRFRMASAPIENPVTSEMKIYFVEKKDGTSSFREVEVNEYGAITDWPEGFFDQSQDEAEQILRAGIAKRNRTRK